MSIKTFKQVLEDEDHTIVVTAPPSQNTYSVNTFFCKLFESRDVAHLTHLSTKSYAAHMALNSYYTGIIDLVDGLVESYQGTYGALIDIKIGATSVADPLAYFIDLQKCINECKGLFKESHLLNQIDTVMELVTSTIYKLKFLS